jgi:hypothetical protein
MVAGKPFTSPTSDNPTALAIPADEFPLFREQYEAIRSRAWERIVRDSRTVILP